MLHVKQCTITWLHCPTVPLWDSHLTSGHSHLLSTKDRPCPTHGCPRAYLLHMLSMPPSCPTTPPTVLYSAECLCVPHVMPCGNTIHIFTCCIQSVYRHLSNVFCVVCVSAQGCHACQPSFRMTRTASCWHVRRAIERLSMNCSQRTKLTRMWWMKWGINQLSVSLSTLSWFVSHTYSMVVVLYTWQVKTVMPNLCRHWWLSLGCHQKSDIMWVFWQCMSSNLRRVMSTLYVM